VAPAVAVDRWLVEPYLHVTYHELYNPLTDKWLRHGEGRYDELLGLVEKRQVIADLSDDSQAWFESEGWLVEDAPELASRFFLKYVSLEAHTVCNQGCYFCPVSVSPREPYFMPSEQYEDIVRQLSEFKDSIEGVSMIHYNEPTIDKRFVDQVGLLHRYGLPPAVLTNGSGLTPKKVDAILELGGLKFLSINFSTLNREQYSRQRDGDHLQTVVRNLDYMRDLPLAEAMEIVVLGTGDEEHQRDFAEIEAKYAGSRFEVKSAEVMDRAGNLPIGLKPSQNDFQLAGCEQTGSRPLQWAHITPHGKLVFCCQDYHDQYVIGDLNEKPLREILMGEEMAQYRRWAYGLDEAPADFICRFCIYALKH
jgi:MoaA/NifB/PqqE/SkfB family radical SAM enzyme